MRKGPRLSVCIPVYNGADYISQAVESVLDQQFRDCELVICDDASSDRTPDICGRYRDNRVRYVRFHERGGQAHNFNRCFQESRGALVTLLHADDFYLPDLVARRVAQLDAHPYAGFVCGAIQMVDARGKTLSTSRPWAESRLFAPGGLVEPLLHGCVISSLGLVARRECWVPFDADLTWGHDWDWELRLAQENAAHYDAEPLACYRVHDASGTAEVLSAAKNGDQERRILEGALARRPIDEPRTRALRHSALRALALRHLYFAEQALLQGRARVTRYNLRYAVRADAFMALRMATWALLFASVAGTRWYSGFQWVRGVALRGPRVESGMGRR
jgi:glycosyltransferase involved in cell wall biosynthesis